MVYDANLKATTNFYHRQHFYAIIYIFLTAHDSFTPFQRITLILLKMKIYSYLGKISLSDPFCILICLVTIWSQSISWKCHPFDESFKNPHFLIHLQQLKTLNSPIKGTIHVVCTEIFSKN